MLRLSEPKIFQNELKFLNQAVKNNDLATGKFISKFENETKKFTSSKYSLSCINGTAALHISLKVLGIKKNDEVIVPTLTFIATVNSVIYNEASPIFMDSDKYFNINAEKTIDFIKNFTIYKYKKTFNKKTKKRIFAIIITHVWGNAADIESLVSLCIKRNIKIIEDATESLGTKYIKGKFNNKHCGNIGDIGCISFNGNKIITSAGGGMIITNNKKYIVKARLLINQYKLNNIFFKHGGIGYNYRISNIHSAIGYAQLKNIKKILKIKKRIYSFYKKEIEVINGLSLLSSPSYANNNNWMNILIIEKYKLTRNQLINLFKKNKIEVRPIWHLNHLQTIFKKYQKFKIENSIYQLKNSICLPSGAGLSLTDLNKIIKILKINA